jgi:hypothetical protein
MSNTYNERHKNNLEEEIKPIRTNSWFAKNGYLYELARRRYESKIERFTRINDPSSNQKGGLLPDS